MMTRQIMRICVLVALVMTPQAVVAKSCAKPKFSNSELQVVDPKRISQRTLSSAMLKVTNYHRCVNGRTKLREKTGLRRAASMHGSNMARYRVLSHQTPKTGEASIKQRYRKAGVRTKIWVENILTDARMNVGSNIYYSKDASACKFTLKNQQEVPAHSYASLAVRAGQLWMKSAGHRKNMLETRVKYIGTGAGYTRQTSHPCGSFYLAQNFSG